MRNIYITFRIFHLCQTTFPAVTIFDFGTQLIANNRLGNEVFAIVFVDLVLIYTGFGLKSKIAR
ncbi:hypothetical protein BDZ94DRAFT_1263400 [Collybia nuda]|uniref:Uncharacterized protein n=1 Tax=Collybia nuda TaxID=64659 RepID=A0A9P6CI69_9AGAR|nr:hypothetical protein BDZ94DRAFT_1263400 [Collybia nuda]